MSKRLKWSEAFGDVSGKRIVVWYTVLVIFVCLWYHALYNLVVANTIWPYESVSMMLRQITLGSLPFILLFYLNTLLIFRLDPFEGIVPRIIFDIIGSTLIVVLVNMTFYFVSILLGKQPHIFWAASVVVDFLVLLLNEVGYFIISYRLSQSRADKARRMAAEMQYDVLKAQVNPHFLFNSLNLLYSLIDLDSEKSKEFILSLSRMYRYIMIQHERQRVSVKEELKLVSFYTEVLLMRFLEQLKVKIITDPDMEEQLDKKEIIPFSLQMLLENATKHNVIASGSPMCIEIHITNHGITVSNPIRPKKVLPPSGIGLSLDYIKKIYSFHGLDFKVLNDHKVFTVIIPYL